jgi:Tfp pilus assembly protein PilO
MTTRSPFLLLLLWVSALAAMLWLFVWPAFTDALDAQRVLSTERQSLAAVRAAEADVEAAVAAFVGLDDNLKEPVALAAPVFPNEHDIAVVLERAAQESGFLVSELIVEEDATPKDGRVSNIRSVSATISAEGEYASLKQFLESTERSLRIFDPQHILVEQNTPEAATPLRFEIMGRAYFIRQVEQTPES